MLQPGKIFAYATSTSLRNFPACLFVLFTCAAAAAPQRDAEPPAAAIRRLLDTAHCREAESAARQWAAQLEASGQTDSLEFAAALDLLADSLATASAPLPEIQSLVDRSLSIQTKWSGPGDPSLAESLNILGLRKFRSGDYAGSIADFTRAQAVEQKASAAVIATTLNGLGLAIGGKGDPTQAVQLHQRALALREEQFGKDHWLTAEVLFSLSTDYRQVGDLQRSLEFSQRSVEMFEHTNPKHPSAAMAIGALASVYRERQEYSRAKPLFEKAIQIFTENFGPDSPRLVASYNNYGLCLKSLSDFSGAGAALEQAVRISTKANGPKSSLTAQTLGNLGILYQQAGDFPRARQAYESALSILEETLGPQHEATASVLTSLGLILRDMGDLRAARPYIERALAIYTKSFGPENPKTIQLVGNLASIYTHEKNYLAARPLVESSLEIVRRTLGSQNNESAGEMAALASILWGLGKTEPAKDLYRQSIAISDADSGVGSASAAQARSELSDLELSSGNYSEARQLSHRAHLSFDKLFGPDYPLLAGVLAVEAGAERKLGNTAIALDDALESARIRRRNLLAVARTTSERQALLYAEKGGDGLDVALKLAAAGISPEQRTRVWDAVIRDRALILDEMAERQRSANDSSDPQLSNLNRSLMLAREELAKSVVAGPRAKESDYSARVNLLRANVETRERQLALRSADFRLRLDREHAGFEEVSSRLPRNSALAAYVRYSEGYLAFLIRAGETSPTVVPIGSVQQVGSLFARWRSQIDREREFQGREAVKNEMAYREAGSALRRALWDPLARYFTGVENVYLTTDGVLQLVNFSALPVGKVSYLMETGPLLHLLSTERDLREPAAPSASPGQMLALGRPAFDWRPASSNAPTAQFRGVRSNCVAFSSLDFADLPGSASETDAVLKVWRAQGNTGISLTGQNATESALKQYAAGKRVIHIATHGFFLGSGCESQMSLEDPLLRSGLALAGANRRSSAGPAQDDGIFTAEEVASLDLSSAELVVLSGCDTGSGEIRAGEGVLGLRRAFQVAGARNLIMSLWPVTDDGARQWMTALYQSRFGKNRGTAASVREASLSQLRARRAAHLSTHPFYWAGFISVGES
jgi:CHAT domain-containing protein/Flp pilus assembly protein TadD